MILHFQCIYTFILIPSLVTQHLCIAMETSWGWEKMETKTETPGEWNTTFVFGSREKS